MIYYNLVLCDYKSVHNMSYIVKIDNPLYFTFYTKYQELLYNHRDMTYYG